MRRFVASFALSASVSFAVGCAPPSDAGAPGSEAATGSTGGGASGPPCQGQGVRVLAGCVAPRGTYVPLEGAEREAIANAMWTVMTDAPCWYKEGTTQTYSFYGDLQYTFWGVASDFKSGGTLGVESVGRYEDKDAAVVTLRSESWMIVVHDRATLTLGKLIAGQPYVETYRAQPDGRCL